MRAATRRRPPVFPRHARGFSLLESALLVLLIGGALVTGFLLLRAQVPVQQAQVQEQALQAADEALVAYAAAHARLPCPVTAPGSDTCVSAGAKGWLPVRALEEGLQRPLAIDNRRLPPLRYVAYGGSGATDLAVASDRFNPQQWDGTAYDFKAINGLDLCAGLASAARESVTANSARANVLDADGLRINVAYALAAAGPSAGNGGGRFDGRNQDDAAQMESPAQVASADYDDRVRARGFDSLARTLGCGYADAGSPDNVMAASLDLVALSVGVSDEVTEQHDGNKEDTALSVVFASLSEVFAGINVALAGANVANSSSTLATASAQLSAAIAACALPPWAQCVLIPIYTAAVTAGSIAVGLSIAATVTAAIALAPTSAALALTIQASELAKQPLGSSSANLTEAMQNVCLAAEGGYTSKGVDANGNAITLDPPVWHDGLKQDVEKAEQDLATAIDERDGARARLDALEATPPSPLIKYLAAPDPDASDDDDDDANYNAWVALQRQWEAELKVKLEAIRASESARFEYEKSVKAEQDAQRDLDTLVDNSVQVGLQVTDCNGNPPADIAGQLRCDNVRAAQRALDLCEFDPSDTTSRDQRQCVPWKREDLATASSARASAYTTWQSRQNEALGKAQPPLNDYIDNQSGCWLLFSCDVLLVPNQDEDDKRETYAKTYFKYLGMVEAVRLAQANVDQRRADYAQMQSQCDDLRKLSLGGDAEGAVLGVVIGAEEMLRAADDRGAVGAVQSSPGADP
jgi:type II secretory pathway pseudopilin PulG